MILRMKIMLAAVLAVLLVAGSAFAQSDFVEFQRILDTKCSRCHTRDRIEQAMRSGKNFDLIMAKMLRFGAKLSNREQQVLGIFWSGAQNGEPVQSGFGSAGPTVSKDPLGEYRAILERRCTGCHTLDRVEKAMTEGRSLDDLLAMMRQRGAIIPESEKKVLGTFWGKPFRPKLPE